MNMNEPKFLTIDRDDPLSKLRALSTLVLSAYDGPKEALVALFVLVKVVLSALARSGPEADVTRSFNEAMAESDVLLGRFLDSIKVDPDKPKPGTWEAIDTGAGVADDDGTIPRADALRLFDRLAAKDTIKH